MLKKGKGNLVYLYILTFTQFSKKLFESTDELRVKQIMNQAARISNKAHDEYLHNSKTMWKKPVVCQLKEKKAVSS